MNDRVALVTGGSRGVGKGIAAGLGETGWTVYVTGRSAGSATEAIGGTLEDTVSLVNSSGGTGIAIRCDHTDDEAVAGAFARVRDEQGRLDLLVNNAYAGPADIHDGRPFFDRSLREWDSLIHLSLRGAFVASVHAGKLMTERRSGLIVNVSSFGGGAYLGSVLYGIEKAGLDKMAHDMAVELEPFGVSAVSLWLGPVLTEKVKAMGVEDILGFSLSEAETPFFAGRVVAALGADPALAGLSGQTIVAAEYASDHGITTEDGRRPPSLRGVLGSPPFENRKGDQ